MTVIGSVLADYVIHQANDDVAGMPFRHGGVARNVAENLGWMGARVELVTLLSPDGIGAEMRARLERAGVHVRARETEGGVGRFVGLMGAGGEVRRQQLVTPPYERLDWAFVQEQLGSDGGYVVLETGLRPELLASLAAHARALGLTTVAMPTRIYDIGLPMEVLRGFHGIVANGQEFSTLLGMPIQDTAAAEAGVRRLLEEGLTWAIVTLGAQGVVAGHAQQEIRFYPAPPAQVVSTLGAGDAFASGFIGGMCLHGDFSCAIRGGLEAARRTVEVAEAVRSGPCEEVLMRTSEGRPAW
ncbi:ribokinase [Melittangium boletus DSM 14713]|uniref:Ribokinase n=1 Tax=Melittangium boletus DSM 14713 TaxID=1294270 RepID=A0A250IAX0_9BACT|nr:ribokinase [Melittangium boletus DSM 14713]